MSKCLWCQHVTAPLANHVKITPQLRNHPSSPLLQTHMLTLLKPSPYILLPNSLNPKDTILYLRLRTMTAQKPPFSSPVTKPSPLNKRHYYTLLTYYPTMDSQSL